MRQNSRISSEKALVERARGGDQGAFECIMDRYQERVTRVILSIFQNPIEAEEVAQDVFMTIFDKIDQCPEEASFSIWIHRIAINAALMRKRSERARGDLQLEKGAATCVSGQGPALSVDWTCGEDNQALSTEARREIGVSVENLEEKYRIVFLLRDIEGMSTAEIAAVLDLSIAVVKTRLHRARMTLCGRLAAHLETQVQTGEILRKN
jgi:RNA polymerase sigma-70 factor, ECF subfamily